MTGKFEKKHPAAGFKRILIAVSAFLVIAAVIVVIIYCGNDRENIQQSEPQTTASTESCETEESLSVPTETTIPEDTTGNLAQTLGLLEFENGEIQTPHLTLYYPEPFEDYLLVVNRSTEPYILEFYATLPDRAEQRIFDLYLDAKTDGYLGNAKTEAGEIPVSMTVYAFVPDDTWSQGEIDTVLAMQEAANELISRLKISDNDDANNAPVLEEAPVENSIVNFLEFDTPYCVLQYPAVWAEWLHVEQIESEDVYTVEFYYNSESHDPILLFSVLLGGDEGEQLGIVTSTDGITVPVNLLMNAPSEEGVPDDELETIYAMQEAVNHLINQLPLH